jgi:hypothetical protein
VLLILVARRGQRSRGSSCSGRASSARWTRRKRTRRGPPGRPRLLNDNGAYSWFTDERVVVQDGKLVVGSVRAVGLFVESEYHANAGNVEVMVWDLETDAVDTTILFNKLEQDATAGG